jgi:HEAT repeat protein
MKVDPAVVQLLIIGEAAAFVILVMLALMVTASGRRTALRRNAMREAWLRQVVPRIGDEKDAPESGAEHDAAGLGRDDRWAITTISRLTGQLSGQSAERLLATKGDAHARAAAQRWCRSRRPWRRVQGVRALNLLQAAQPDLTYMLGDPRPEVRTEAAAWVATHPTTDGIRRLLAMLGDDQGRCRWAASDALLRLGAEAVDPLGAHLDTDPPRLDEALRLAAQIATPALLAPALRACANPGAAVRAAAAQAVTAVGGEPAVEALTSLLRDNDAEVRAAAARGLGDLECWTRAAEVADLLYDPVWAVRRSAAATLRALGPVGRLHLRRALTDADPRAAEIAQHVVDLPEVAVAVGH